jgi:hypothetical protein
MKLILLTFRIDIENGQSCQWRLHSYILTVASTNSQIKARSVHFPNQLHTIFGTIYWLQQQTILRFKHLDILSQ